jgi:hypothetical protein
MAPYTVDTAKQHMSPVQADIAVTALHHLIYDSGVRPEHQTAWNLDGRSWLCEMGLCSDKTVGPNSINEADQPFDFKIMANPSVSGNFTIWCENFDNKQVLFMVTDMSGKVVKQITEPTSSLSHRINLSDLAKGTYNLTTQSGSKSATKGIVLE